jgi:hypothetical protein
MRIPTQLRQTLISTGVVGSVFGLLVALASFAFYSEYGPHISSAPHGTLANALHAVATFILVTCSIIVAFGLLPSAVSFALSKVFRRGG